MVIEGLLFAQLSEGVKLFSVFKLTPAILC
jgi:hypothetical protein